MAARQARNTRSSNGGQITFGGVDKRFYAGEMSYTPVISGGHWLIGINDLSVGNTSTNVCEEGCIAVVDTGTSLVVGPNLEVEKLQELIGAVPFHDSYTVDCDKLSELPDVSFCIGDSNYVLKAGDYVLREESLGQEICLSCFSGMDMKVALWILGDVFIGRYYTVFDQGNRQVGFAEAVQAV